jgi:hypothetical protein
MDLKDLIIELTGFKGKIFWGKSKPEGQPRRTLVSFFFAQKEYCNLSQ